MQKTFQTRIKALGGRSFQFVISTGSVDRDNDVVDPEGWNLDDFMRNPVVMWGHNYQEPPIARATHLEVMPGVGISARFEFPPAGIHPLADTVRGLWDAGFVNAASIGFMPLEWEMIDDPEQPPLPTRGGDVPLPTRGGDGRGEVGRKGQRDQIPAFTRWELYEFSLVAVPRDREAVRRALDAASSAPPRNRLETQRLAAFDALVPDAAAEQTSQGRTPTDTPVPCGPSALQAFPAAVPPS